MSSDDELDLSAQGGDRRKPQEPVNNDQLTIWQKIPFREIIKNTIVAVCVASILGLFGLVFALVTWKNDVDSKIDQISSLKRKLDDTEKKLNALQKLPDFSGIQVNSEGFVISGNLKVRDNVWDGDEFEYQWLADGDAVRCPSGYFVAGIQIEKNSADKQFPELIKELKFLCHKL